MLRCLIKRQWKVAVGLVLLFGAMFLLYRQGFYSSYADVLFTEEVRTYINSTDVSDREAFFAQLNEDVAETTAVMNAILFFEGYEGERPEEDPLTGRNNLANYDMLIWRSQMQHLPGRIGETVFADQMIVRNVKERVALQENFEEIIGNHQEIMRRGIRRGGEKVPIYEAIKAELDTIETEFDVQDTYYAQNILIELNRDWYILALIALTVFTVFSQSNQLKVSRVIATSKLGPFRYTVSQLCTTMVLTVVAFWLYWVLMILILCEFRPYEIPWGIPIQAVSGYQTVMLNRTFGQYVLQSLALRCLLCMALSSLVLLVSALSPNSIVSLIGAAAVCGGLIYGDQLLPQTHGLLVGHMDFLFDQLCYVNMNGRAVPYAMLYLGGLAAAIVVLWGLVLLLAPAAIRKWGK